MYVAPLIPDAPVLEYGVIDNLDVPKFNLPQVKKSAPLLPQAANGALPSIVENVEFPVATKLTEPT